MKYLKTIKIKPFLNLRKINKNLNNRNKTFLKSCNPVIQNRKKKNRQRNKMEMKVNALMMRKSMMCFMTTKKSKKHEKINLKTFLMTSIKSKSNLQMKI